MRKRSESRNRCLFDSRLSYQNTSHTRKKFKNAWDRTEQD